MITKPKHILVPTDFSETASHALRYASNLAHGLGASLTVVYCDPFLPPIDYTATVGGWDEGSFAELKARAQDQLRHDAEVNIDPSVPYETVVGVAPPLEGILAQALQSKADLIVMGTHGRTGFRRLFIGSVAESVMRKSDAPVITVPPRCESTPAIRTVICPAIERDQCFDALSFAAAIVPTDAKFIVVGAAAAQDPVQTAQDLAKLRGWVPEAIASRCEAMTFGSGHVADQIAGYAAALHADLIVAVEPVDRSAADVLYGTFAARLVQSSHCPVLTVNFPASMRVAQLAELQYRTDLVFSNH